MGDKGWKRSGVLSLFASTYSAPEVSTVVVLSSKMAGDWSVENKDLTTNQSGIQVSTGPGSATSNNNNNNNNNTDNSSNNADSNSSGTVLGTIGWLGWNRSDNLAAAAVASDFPSTSTSSSTSTSASTSTHMKVVFREEFLITSIFGADKIRDLALRVPFLSLQLRPFITIAIRLPDRNEIDQGLFPPHTGLVFCNGGLIGESGLPFHVEGPFLQNPGVRHLPLPVSPDTYLDNAEQINQVMTFFFKNSI